MSDKTIKLFLSVITILLLLNIAATGYLFNRQFINNTGNPAAWKSDISKELAMEIAKPVIQSYNADDNKNLFMQFDEFARIQFSEESMAAEMIKLKNLMGNVDEYIYDRAEFAGKQNDKEFIALFYLAKLSGKDFKHGEVKITVMKKENKYVLVGFFVSGKTQAN